MEDNIETIPDNMMLEEASEFWDNHSVADYPTRIIQAEYMPNGRTTLVAIAEDLMMQVQHKAKLRGISTETMINLWVQEKLAA